MELSYYWTLVPRIDIGWVPDTFILIHLFIYSIATYRAFIMGSLLSIQPPDPGGLPLSHLRTHSPWLDPPQCQAACLAPQRLLTSPLTLFVCGVRELPGKRKLFWFVCVCVYDTQRLKERRRIETSTTTLLL